MHRVKLSALPYYFLYFSLYSQNLIPEYNLLYRMNFLKYNRKCKKQQPNAYLLTIHFRPNNVAKRRKKTIMFRKKEKVKFTTMCLFQEQVGLNTC